jgi:hypothetical protein
MDYHIIGGDFEDYCITRDGKTVFDRWNGRRYPIQTLASGYQQVTLENRAGVKKICYVHRLMAMAYIAFHIPTDLGRGMDVHHKDLNRSNNNLDNLDIVTHRENLQMRGPWTWDPSKKGPRPKPIKQN